MISIKYLKCTAIVILAHLVSVSALASLVRTADAESASINSSEYDQWGFKWSYYNDDGYSFDIYRTNADAAKLQISSAQKRRGNNSLLFRCNPDVNGGSDRTEMFINRSIPFDSIRYYSFSYFVPSDMPTPTDWTLFAQWWQDHVGGKSPPVAIQYVENSNPLRMQLVIRNDDNSAIVHAQWNAVKGSWRDFLVAIQPSTSNGGGAVHLYWKAPSSSAYTQIGTSYYGKVGYSNVQSGKPKVLQWKIGCYRGPQNLTHSFYYDEIHMGTTWGDVAIGAN